MLKVNTFFINDIIFVINYHKQPFIMLTFLYSFT